MQIEKLLMWGYGKRGQEFMTLLDNYPDYGCEIVGITDRKVINILNKPYYSMETIKKCDYDKIVITIDCPESIEEIKKLIFSNKLAEDKNVYWYYDFIADLRKKKLIEKYKYADDEEIKKCIKYLHKNKLSVRNIWENKATVRYKIKMDSEFDMPYVTYYGKRMYYPRRYWSQYGERGFIENVEEVDQYKGSPHLYTFDGHDINEGDVLLDAGACEGNFALKHIEKVSKVYLVEPEDEWMEVLKLSFRPWKDKVVFVKKFLGDVDGPNEVTIDNLFRSESRLDFVKMDIEGNEPEAILGGVEVFGRLHPKLSICSYHKKNDERSIRFLLDGLGYNSSVSDGYMFFIWDKNIDSSMDFRRGVVYGKFNEE